MTTSSSLCEKGDGYDVSFAESSILESKEEQAEHFLHNTAGFRDHSFEESSFFPHNQTDQQQGGISFNQSVEGLTSVNQLHNAFVAAIANMPTRLQLFEVMDEWMIHIERALDIDRHLDPEIPDVVHDKLHRMLKREYETWDLIKTLYFDRLSEKEEEHPRVPFNQEIDDRFRLDEMAYANAIMHGDKTLQEMGMIISWLELNYSRQADPDLTPKLIAWEQTLDTLKRDKQLKKMGGFMVSEIDADAPFRENKELHPLDADEELRIQRGAFHYLRTGNIDKAVSYLHQSGHIAKAKAILGCIMSQKIATDEDPADEDGTIPTLSHAHQDHLLETPNAKRSKHSYVVAGNPHRLLWKNIAWSICEQEMTSKWERSVIGACCGHRQSMLDVASTWEDKLWAYLKAAVNTKIEEKLINLNTVSKSVNLPLEYFSQALDITDILNELDTSERKIEFTIDYMFQLLQKCTMKDDLGLFLREVQKNIDCLFGDADHPIILDHLIRFLTHVLLTFAIAELSYNEPLTNLSCDAYVNVLVKNGLFIGIPFYVQKLSSDLQTSVVVSQINCEIRYSVDEIRDFLQGAADNMLDVLGIATAIVDKFRDEVEDFDVDMLQWISSCYDLLENQDIVMVEFLRYTVWISRKYLTLGDLDKVRRLTKQITQECITAVDKVYPTLVREFVCYREYLEAEDALTLWKQAKTQRPTDQLYNVGDFVLNSVADRALYEKRKRELEITETNWQQALEFYGKIAIEAFMKILMFPDGGWLRDCCNPADLDENTHINAVRRITIKKITFVVLNLIKERNLADKFRDFVYVLCDSRRRILEEFNPTEIGSIFKVIEEFNKAKSPGLIMLPQA